jgi:hypothetical protein
MAEYELVRTIHNLCRNNQMRDVFFEEVETRDPEGYVRGLLQGEKLELTVETLSGGVIKIYAVCDGLAQEFLFTPL